ncbi:GntR family transcriptional regulator [Methylobacterium nodulans]|uniref:Transcriptional regulator, GntR family n=1 Tax=Methylobacterium nodulans (strain LMG 21967 / CNCM I-2342 / ORS 2060) TaxID=460265 RepID=B8IWZ7_METNO|nr:GntR family transcriptional regulator [Methylobacterium nodulans]ACL63038.1 transcriptional regulator, GntR family [Methylobacterium nodulans ORS 2060]
MLNKTPSISQADAAYCRIEEMIVTRELAPGQMISEKRLSEQLGCGRTPLREALQRLKLEGYVEIHASRGILVAPIDVMRQLDLLEVRRSLEDLMVRLGAERASAPEREHLRALARDLQDAAAANDRTAFLRLNRAVHHALSRVSHNEMLASTIAVVHGQSRRFWYSQFEGQGLFEQAARFHGATLEAVAGGNADEASRHAAAFLDFLETLTRNAIERRAAYARS